MSPPWCTTGVPYFVSTMSPMPYVSSLPIGTCGVRRASSVSFAM